MSQTFIHTHSNGIEGTSLYIKPQSRIKIKFDIASWTELKIGMFCGVRRVNGSNYETAPVNETSNSPNGIGNFFIGFSSDFPLSTNLESVSAGQFFLGHGFSNNTARIIADSSLEQGTSRSAYCGSGYNDSGVWGTHSSTNWVGFSVFPGCPPASNNLRFWQLRIRFEQGSPSTKPKIYFRFSTSLNSIYTANPSVFDLTELNSYLAYNDSSEGYTNFNNLAASNGAIQNPFNSFIIYWPFINHYFVISALKIFRVQ